MTHHDHHGSERPHVPEETPRAAEQHGMPTGDYLTLESVARSIGTDAKKLQTCADLNGVHPEGPDGTFTRTQADHLRALCSIGPTFGP